MATFAPRLACSRAIVRSLPWALAAWLPVHVARADAPASGSGAQCIVKGRAPMPPGLTLFTAPDAGLPIAAFSSQEATLELADFPADPTHGRVHVKTGQATGTVRVDGWIDAQKVPLSANGRIAIIEDHIWIGRGVPLRLRGASLGKLTVEATLNALTQKVTAETPCASVSVGSVAVEDGEVPKGAKRWVLKQNALDLFNAPSGTAVYTLTVPSAESSILLFSTEAKGAFVHVRHQGGLELDAWVKSSALKAYPKGEMLDALSSVTLATLSPPRLKVEGPVREVITTKDVPLRLQASEKAPTIGVFGTGTEVVIVDTIAGWSRVFPKSLELVPPEGQDFWVRATELP